MDSQFEIIANLLSDGGFYKTNKILAKKIGFIEASMLGLLCNEYTKWQAYDKLENGGFFFTAETCEEETGFSRYQQNQYFSKLESLGFISTKNVGLPRKKYFFINFDKIGKKLKEYKNEILQENKAKKDRKQELENIKNYSSNNFNASLQNFSNIDVKKFEINKNITNKNINKDDDEINKPTADFQDKVSKTLQKYGGMNINAYITDTLDKSDIPEDLKVEAIERWIGASDTSSQKLPSANYLKKILANIKKSGATTVEELEAYENENKKSNSDRWYELQKQQVELKKKELDLKEQNQPYYQQQIKMQYDKENSSQYLAQTLAYEEEKQRLQKLSGDVPKQIGRTLPTKDELQLMSNEERKRVMDGLSLEEIKQIWGDEKV